MLDGIFAAKAAGIEVKLNAVALKGVNENENRSHDRLVRRARLRLTLIEIMPLGDIDGDRIDQYLPLSVVRARLRKQLDAGRDRLPHRRPGALLHGARDRRPARLHHAADP